MATRKKKTTNIKDLSLAYAIRKGDINIDNVPEEKRNQIGKIVKGPIDTHKLERAAKSKYKISRRKVKHLKNESKVNMEIDFKNFIKNIDDEEWKDKVRGGLAKNRKPSDFDLDDLASGADIQMEHTDDPEFAIDIAMDHLEEHPDYYDDEIGLPAMERDLEDEDGEDDDDYEDDEYDNDDNNNYKPKNNNMTMEKRFTTKFSDFKKVNEDNEPNPQKIPRENKFKGFIEFNEDILKSLEEHRFNKEEGAEEGDFIIFDVMTKSYKFADEMPEDIRPYNPRAFDHVMNNL
jgi:hypothetical protein